MRGYARSQAVLCEVSYAPRSVQSTSNGGRVSGGYNKTNVARLPISTAQVIQAMQRARDRDDGTGDIPGAPGTRAHELLDTLIRRDVIELE